MNSSITALSDVIDHVNIGKNHLGLIYKESATRTQTASTATYAARTTICHGILNRHILDGDRTLLCNKTALSAATVERHTDAAT
jgi:hypothetical protein